MKSCAFLLATACCILLNAGCDPNVDSGFLEQAKKMQLSRDQKRFIDFKHLVTERIKKDPKEALEVVFGNFLTPAEIDRLLRHLEKSETELKAKLEKMQRFLDPTERDKMNILVIQKAAQLRRISESKLENFFQCVSAITEPKTKPLKEIAAAAMGCVVKSLGLRASAGLLKELGHLKDFEADEGPE